ncbi:MAG: hypothetical protein EZS26_001004 [Candidatus Ordinivivax streblomastigis]|uniref:Uncharacterized protein n=1 Tax=Candidatus Ordinivivax streblomastigis TaxID=2540710 RepID=A0A5M8P365_9BACT|nr:MAG: hypothetical protein EZS26_001004 [Candidatus Ordinivivax streblomastigis]
MNTNESIKLIEEELEILRQKIRNHIIAVFRANETKELEITPHKSTHQSWFVYQDAYEQYFKIVVTAVRYENDVLSYEICVPNNETTGGERIEIDEKSAPEYFQVSELISIYKTLSEYIPPVADWNKWWYSAEFTIMERITGYQQLDFDPEGESQAFVDACDAYWENLPTDEKQELWKEYNR